MFLNCLQCRLIFITENKYFTVPFSSLCDINEHMQPLFVTNSQVKVNLIIK